jgi:hypothetical protein
MFNKKGVKMKLLIPLNGVPAIFFPVGEIDKGGTCEFATKKCLEMCSAFRNATDENIIGYEPKLKIFKFIIKMPLFLVCHQIMEDLNQMNSKLLYWFASGDCMKKHIDRISTIMKHLSLEEIIQCGFTRNKTLWKRTQQIQNINIALTMEFKDVSKIGFTSGLISVPDYKTGKIKLYMNNVFQGSCGGYRTELKEAIQENDCNKCYEMKKGCFTVFEESD